MLSFCLCSSSAAAVKAGSLHRVAACETRRLQSTAIESKGATLVCQSMGRQNVGIATACLCVQIGAAQRAARTQLKSTKMQRNFSKMPFFFLTLCAKCAKDTVPDTELSSNYTEAAGSHLKDGHSSHVSCCVSCGSAKQGNSHGGSKGSMIRVPL